MASVSCTGNSKVESFASPRDNAKMALSGRGIDECVDVPVADTMTPTDDLSAVAMLTYCTFRSSPAMIQPPSFSANSASICAQWVCASHDVLYCAASSSASTTKMTSRASGTLRSANCMTARAKTAMPPLKSMAPRP